MEEPEKMGLSSCGTSESTVTRDEKVGGETLEKSVECRGQAQKEGSFSEVLVGDDGGCNGMDVMVEVLGSDVYIDGVCTRGSDAELNEAGCGGSVEDAERLDKDVKPAEVGNRGEAQARVEGSQVVGSLEARSENAPTGLDGVALEKEDGGRAEVSSDEFGGVASIQGTSLLDNRDQKEVGTGVSDSFSVVHTTSGVIEVPPVENVGVESMNALDAGVLDHKVTNTRCDNSLGCSSMIGSLGEENVQSRRAEKDNQQERNLADHRGTEDGNDVTLKTLDEQKSTANLQSDKILEKEVKLDEELNSVGEQPMEIDKVGDNSNSILKVVAGAEVAVEKQCSRLEKCLEKEQMTDTSRVSSDTGQGMEVDKDFRAEGCALLPVEQNTENCETVDASTNRDAQVLINSEGIANSNHEDPGYTLHEQPLKSIEMLEKDMGGGIALDDSCSTKEVESNKNFSDAEQHSLHKGQKVEVEVEDQPESIKTTADIRGTTPFGVSEKNLVAKTVSRIVEEDAQIASDVTLDESNINQNVDGQAGISEQVGSHGGQEIEVEEFHDTEQRKTTDGKVIKRASMKPGSSGMFYQASYLLPTEKEGEFSVSDMVWGKVRSHPWWPGQIFDPSYSSEKAMKHYKKDCYLVAYFGDRTFAWNEASQLKPFRTHFSYIEKQSTSESFQNSVDCALDEVARRVEFGLACSCLPKDTYDTIKFQTVENTGIQQELCLRREVDESLNASFFSPDKLREYLKTLSELPTGGFDQLELVVAKAQLLAFYRLKGYSCLPEFQNCGGLEDDMDTVIHDGEKNSSEDIENATPVSNNDVQAGPENLKSPNSSRRKRKHNLKDGMYLTKKERSLSELMGGTPDSPDGDYWSDEKVTDNLVLPPLSKKRRTTDHYADDSGMQDGRKTISLAKVSNTTKQSFKIGECIRRVASQLTGSPAVLKSSGDRSPKTDGSTDGFSGNASEVSFQNLEEAQRSSSIVPTEYSSLDDLLSSLQWLAQEPKGDYSFLNAIVSFFSDFRNSVVVVDDFGKEVLPTDKVGTKRKKPPIAGSPETFEFEDMSDTYWTDRVIENGSEEQPSRRNRKKDSQTVPAESEKPVQVSRRSNSRKRYSDSNLAEAPEKPSGYIDENSPAELVMNFAELDSVPSETSLNKMFRRFGPLKESETEVDRVSSRARVVFKKRSDAEVACSSAKKFNIFGPILVNYELNYTPSALFKASSVAATQDQEMHLDFSNFEVNMV